MEEHHVQITEEQLLAQLMAEAEAAPLPTAPLPAAPLPAEQSPPAAPMPDGGPVLRPLPAKRNRKRSPYRYGALLLAGLFCYALLIAVAVLIWGSMLFARLGDVGDAVAIPLAIILSAVFLSCCVVTALSRGGTIFPALGLAVIVNIIPLLFAQAMKPQPVAIGCTLIAAIAGFALSKALYIRGKNKRGPV